MENLTARELELAKLVAAGFSNQQIADRFMLALQTVKNHLRSVYKKLHVTNRVELSLRISGKSAEDLRLRFVFAEPNYPTTTSGAQT